MQLPAIDGRSVSVRDTVPVNGGGFGINAGTYGDGNVIVNASRDVTGGNASTGIYVFNQPGGNGDLTVNAVSTSGPQPSITGGYGIRMFNYGPGASLINTTGIVTGTNSAGIWARNFAGSGMLTITTAAVTGGTNGVEVFNQGNAATTINTVGGAVMGTTANGIDAANGASATSLTINTAAVIGGTNGISAVNSGVRSG